MKQNIYKHLLNQDLNNPMDVDRLIVSAFLHINSIKVCKNKLLRKYLITNSIPDEYNKLIDFIDIIRKNVRFFDFEILIEFFEFVISPADKIVNGAVYTPSKIRTFIVDFILTKRITKNEVLKISDISCGCGGFLYDSCIAIKKMTNKPFSEIFEKYIYGLDIKDFSITRTKLLLSLLAVKSGEDEEIFSFNLFVGDALDFQWSKKIKLFSGFDVIIGNPPYVRTRNLDSETKKKLKKWTVCETGNSDLYIPFFQIAIENLANNGILGFITMNSFFKSLNGRALRKYLQKKTLKLSIIDFGSEQIFRSTNTYTCICFIESNKDKNIKYLKIQSNLLNSSFKWEKIGYNSLDPIKGWNLNSNSLITKIESTGKPLGELFLTRHGIATLKNNIYIFKPFDEDENYYYLQNGRTYKIEKGICKDIVNSNKLSREVDFNKIVEKIIFPYDWSKKPKLLSEELIKKKFNMTYKYLLDNKYILAQRDKGKGNYENWYAFGRTQSLLQIKNKLLFPKYSDKIPNYIITTNENLLFYNGLAIIGVSFNDMIILKKILESSIFWYYITTTSKPYASNYFSLNGNYIKNFGICELDEDEKNFVLKENNRKILDEFFGKKYEIELH